MSGPASSAPRVSSSDGEDLRPADAAMMPSEPSPNDYFEAWLSRGGVARPRINRAEQQRRDRAAAQAELAASRSALQSTIGTALARYVAGDELAVPAETDDALRHRRRAVVVEEVKQGKVTREGLAKALNAGHPVSVARHIDTCRQFVEEEEAQEAAAAAKLAPNRRERPVSKEDVSRTNIHREARIMVAAIVNSKGAHVIQSYLRRLRSIFSGQPLAALRDAALKPLPQGGCTWTYADECARRRIAIGLMWLCTGRWTSQRVAFGSRSTRRGLLIAGLSVDRILRIARPVGRKQYDRHVFGSRTNEGWLGDMAHFERAGFAIRKRLPPARCNAWEIGESGNSKNRYWIGCVVSQRTPREAPGSKRRRALPPTLGAIVGQVAFNAPAHEIGWAWCDEVPAYPVPPSAAPS